MKILIVNGAPRSGKDSFCNFAKEHQPHIYTYSTIDEVKRLAKEIGWDGQKDEKGRRLLSDLKDALTLYNDLPTQSVLNEIKKKISLDSSNDFLFLIQMREPDDIKRWKVEHCARAIHIIRPDMESKWGNHADDKVLDYKNYDYRLVNDSTLWDWKKKTFDFIDRLRKENWESRI